MSWHGFRALANTQLMEIGWHEKWVDGGLITSTFLSLLVIPVVYSCVDDLVQWMRNHSRRFTRHELTVHKPTAGPA
jgi:hypothetical protein